MKRRKPSPKEIDWKKRDRRILFTFFGLLELIILGVVVSEALSGDPDLLRAFSNGMGGLTGVFSLTGILAFIYYMDRGIVPMKRIAKSFAKIALVGAIVSTVLLTYLEVALVIEDSLQLVVAALVIYLGMFLAFFLALFIFMLMGFGVMAVLFIGQKRFTSETLISIKGITANTEDPTKIQVKKKGMEFPILHWMYAIPDVLDTGTLTIDRVGPRDKFPWKPFLTALKWETIFSMVLAVYVSLNPFLLGWSDLAGRFSLASNLSILVPMFILPWFIFLRLNARIKGPVRDFKLFNGIKGRMASTLIAFGTLIVFIRYALRDIGALEIIQGILGFYLILLAVIVVVTFVYFNNFEDPLVRTTLRELEKREDGPAMTAVEPEDL
ncbi:MAG: hypothetical protein KAR39_01235 [Thermoplasmata archaeon]|nr:hypothetical protein [Thermoplasmata archaeon]